MEFFNVLMGRRSVRKYLLKEVEKEKLLRVLEAGRWAPSAGNSQEWRFVVVEDEKRRGEIAEASFGQYWMVSAPVHIVVLSKYDMVEKLYGTRGLSLYVPQDAAAAVQNMLLAAHDQELGACWVGAFDDIMVRDVIKAPDDVKIMAIVTLGYPAEKPQPPHRVDLNLLVFFDTYGKREKSK